MSLSTHIAIGPSRYLASARAAMIAGTVILTAATMAARLVDQSASAALWLVAGVAMMTAVAICAKRWIKPGGSCVYEVFISDRAAVSVRYPGEGTMPQAFALTDASMVWPGFAVLSLAPSPVSALVPASKLLARLCHRTLDLAVVRGEIDADGGWRLHRFLLWAQRNDSRRIGSDPGGSNPRDSFV
ncbi:MAG: hypothetical protein ACR2GP_10860 [Burkholderiaceae bacterium]